MINRTALVIVKLCTAGDVARMGTLSASNSSSTSEVAVRMCVLSELLRVTTGSSWALKGVH